MRTVSMILFLMGLVTGVLTLVNIGDWLAFFGWAAATAVLMYSVNVIDFRVLPGLEQRGHDATAVYRIHDADRGKLVYIGMTSDPNRRMRDHAEKWWWPSDPEIQVDWYDSRQDARYAETAAIRRHRPPANRT